MRWYHRIMASFADLIVLIMILFLVTLDATAGFRAIGLSLFSILLVVIVVYLITVIVVNGLMFFMRTAEGKGVNLVKGIIGALLVWLMFPKLLGWGFIIMGSYGVSSMVEIAMLFAFCARAFLASWLGRRWATTVVE